MPMRARIIPHLTSLSALKVCCPVGVENAEITIHFRKEPVWMPIPKD